MLSLLSVLSTLLSRASICVSLTRTGSSCGPLAVAQPASCSTPSSAMVTRSMRIGQFDAPVLRPGCIVVPERDGLLLAIAHRRKLCAARALELQHLAHRLRAPLAERDVVLARSALIGVAFEPHPHVRILRELLCMGAQHVVEVGADLARVIVEV